MTSGGLVQASCLTSNAKSTNLHILAHSVHTVLSAKAALLLGFTSP